MEGSLESKKFAEELHWCISQLELGLQRQAPDSRQAAESIKVLKILKSKKAPLARKRQVMRNTFGDYRKKIKDAEKKSLSGLRHSRFQSLGLVKTPVASRFLKMSHNKQQHIDQVRGDLNTTLNNLHLQSSSQSEPGTSPTTSEFASSLDSELFHQAYHGLDSPGSSFRACLRSTSTSASVQSDQFRHIEDIHSSSRSDKLVNKSESSPTGPHLSSDSDHAHKNSNDCSSSSLVQASTSASHGNGGNNFKYEPSDNSFMFGFDNSESTGRESKVEMLVKDAQTPGSVRSSHFIQKGHDKNVIIYKYEKSENDFRFNFEEPLDES